MHEGEELTPKVIAEYMQTSEGALKLQKILEDLRAASPTGGALGQISDSELGQFRAASPTGGALGQISDSELGQFRAASPTGGEIGQIGLSPDMSGINPQAQMMAQQQQQPIPRQVEENRRRMMQQLMPSRGRGLGLGY
jgi:hypothetical protein